MPGPQLINAVEHSKKLKNEFPYLTIIWGGYFPSMHTNAVLNPDYVDYVVRGQGEATFLELIEYILNKNGNIEKISGLSFRENGKIKHNLERPLLDIDKLPLFPYNRVNVEDYIVPTFIGERTLSHHSSVGCPFKCNFCGVIDVFGSRWVAESPERIANVVRLLKEKYSVSGIEFHDSNFFTSEKRVAQFCEKIIALKINWWGEGRVDTLLDYDNETWKIMQRSGCKMIYFGAESGSNETLKLMNKGGTMSREKTIEIAYKSQKFGIRPEFSLVIGSNHIHPEDEINTTIDFVYELLEIDPNCAVLPFLYTPVPLPGVYDVAVQYGFKYPENLEEWVNYEWAQFDLRQNPQVPWLTPKLVKKIKNFKTVLDCYHPRTNDFKLNKLQKMLMKFFSSWRYYTKFYSYPYELKILWRLFAKRKIVDEGF
jgi:radical SAM superfamily enzyme YgiQ (UPF0313 family)